MRLDRLPRYVCVVISSIVDVDEALLSALGADVDRVREEMALQLYPGGSSGWVLVRYADATSLVFQASGSGSVDELRDYLKVFLLFVLLVLFFFRLFISRPVPTPR